MERADAKGYTYADYLTWDDGNRYELIDGEAFMMSAPSVDHQRISANLTTELTLFLRGKPCEVFAAPFDVRLNADQRDNTVVQPDLVVICDPKKIADGKSCKGPPDMVIEILSPSTINHDQVVKLNQYRKAGVREYWIVNPEAGNVQVFLLVDGLYVAQGYAGTATVPVTILEGCQIDLARIFPPGDTAEA